jgi:hypothetical protein
MKHPAATYINAGRAYELERNPMRMAARIKATRDLIEAEQPEHQHQARQLIEHGRQDARQ